MKLLSLLVAAATYAAVGVSGVNAADASCCCANGMSSTDTPADLCKTICSQVGSTVAPCGSATPGPGPDDPSGGGGDPSSGDGGVTVTTSSDKCHPPAKDTPKQTQCLMKEGMAKCPDGKCGQSVIDKVVSDCCGGAPAKPAKPASCSIIGSWAMTPVHSSRRLLQDDIDFKELCPQKDPITIQQLTCLKALKTECGQDGSKCSDSRQKTLITKCCKQGGKDGSTNGGTTNGGTTTNGGPPKHMQVKFGTDHTIVMSADGYEARNRGTFTETSTSPTVSVVKMTSPGCDTDGEYTFTFSSDCQSITNIAGDDACGARKTDVFAYSYTRTSRVAPVVEQCSVHGTYSFKKKKTMRRRLLSEFATSATTAVAEEEETLSTSVASRSLLARTQMCVRGMDDTPKETQCYLDQCGKPIVCDAQEKKDAIRTCCRRRSSRRNGKPKDTDTWIFKKSHKIFKDGADAGTWEEEPQSLNVVDVTITNEDECGDVEATYEFTFKPGDCSKLQSVEPVGKDNCPERATYFATRTIRKTSDDEGATLNILVVIIIVIVLVLCCAVILIVRCLQSAKRAAGNSAHILLKDNY